jgi:dTDP-L-rhamnose 4-epimerase
MRVSLAMKAGDFEVHCPVCDLPCQPVATPESHPLAPSSYYGLTKQVQERTCILFGEALSLPVFALRYQNVFGPGQSLKNPYTGILAVFSGQAREDKPLRVFEDGLESRDFVFVADVVEATWRCITSSAPGQHAYNVGSGERTSVLEVAEAVKSILNSKSTIEVTGAFRVGDIRHNYADLTRLKEEIGMTPRWGFRKGLEQFLGWAMAEEFDMQGYEKSLDELRTKRLMG